MPVKRTTIELDEALTEQALTATGGTLRSTVELGLRLVIAQSRHDEERRQDVLDRHLANAAKSVDFDALLSGEAWR
jgi:Arc/MetJ family transcription regulator